MQKELKTLGNSVAAAVTAIGFTKDGKGMGHRQGLDVVAKTGGMKNWQAVVALKPKAASESDDEYSLIKDDSSGGDLDYILPVGAPSCWIMVDGISIHIIRARDGSGVTIETLANRSDDIDAIDSTHTLYQDAEDAICKSRKIDIDVVAVWVGERYGNDFDAEPMPERYKWILEYAEFRKSKEVPDPQIQVREVGSKDEWATWNISQNLTDRWGDINAHDCENKPLDLLKSTPGLLEHLRSQMWGEETFIVRNDGKFGILFETEYCSQESENELAEWNPHSVVVKALLDGMTKLTEAYPGVLFAVPHEREVANCRPAAWAFVPDGLLNETERDALGIALASL